MLFLNLNLDLNDTPCTKNPEYYNTSGCRITKYYSHVVAFCSAIQKHNRYISFLNLDSYVFQGTDSVVSQTFNHFWMENCIKITI